MPGTFEYALAHIVDNRLDLSGFDKWYNNDKKGAAAYPPCLRLFSLGILEDSSPVAVLQMLVKPI